MNRGTEEYEGIAQCYTQICAEKEPTLDEGAQLLGELGAGGAGAGADAGLDEIHVDGARRRIHRRPLQCHLQGTSPAELSGHIGRRRDAGLDQAATVMQVSA